MSKQALFVFTSHDSLGDTGEHTGYHLAEASHVWKVLDDAGVKVHFASIRGGQAPIDPASHDLDDDTNRQFLNDRRVQSALQLTQAVAKVDSEDYNILYFPGGHGTMWDFPNNEHIAKLINGVYRNGGIVAAVCHGPAAFIGVKKDDGSYFVKGHRIAAFTNDEERVAEKAGVVPFLLHDKLKEQGATLEPGANFKAQVVTDGRLVTGQNPASAKPLGEAILTALEEVARTDD